MLASAAAPDVEVIAIDPHAGNDRGPQEIDGYAAEAADDHEVFLDNLERPEWPTGCSTCGCSPTLR